MYHDQNALAPARLGYRIVYRANETNHCPGCGRSHWIVGRMSAECAFCATALPLENGLTTGTGLFRSRGKTDAFAPLAA
ncbi:hypothetical protein HFP57_09265 [Parasphingopyxis algicola]|uniref:hypothetical protein n=1 Tax=Parasphingopyxis algicola TaxID=2026624 RepID=UPI0015A22A07|nr:hypothetical protein [Parasphingopyxis algicola]QLC23571.1 hypothetical protein HFP57_09265 [Parasphingopyxis algicola]